MEEETGITLDHNEVKFAYAVNTIFPDISKQYVTVSALGESNMNVCVPAKYSANAELSYNVLSPLHAGLHANLRARGEEMTGAGQSVSRYATVNAKLRPRHISPELHRGWFKDRA